MTNGLFRRGISLAAASLVAASVNAVSAAETCGICNTDVVTNAELAHCFLADYAKFAEGSDPVVVVDLSNCDADSRNVLSLPLPSRSEASAIREPDTQFMVTKTQLACLKQKLEEPGLVLDPFLKIELTACG